MAPSTGGGERVGQYPPRSHLSSPLTAWAPLCLSRWRQSVFPNKNPPQNTSWWERNTKEKGFAWSHSAKERQDHNPAAISEWPSPEPAAHALFPDTFLSLIRFGTDKASPTATVTLLTLPETTYKHHWNYYWYRIRKLNFWKLWNWIRKLNSF